MKDRGIALVAGLLLMTVLSLVALISVSGMILQRQMANNLQENARALEQASRAEAFATAWLSSRADHERDASCLAGCVLPAGILDGDTVPAQPEFENLAWWRDYAVAAGIDPASGESVASLPADEPPGLWFAEEIHYAFTGDPPGENTAAAIGYYRILGRGTGRRASSVAVTEAIFARPWGGGYRPGSYPAADGLNRFCDQFPGDYDCGLLAWRQRR